MSERPQRHHYAFAVEPTKGGWRASNVLEYLTRGQADKAMLTLVGRYGDADSITLDRPMIEGEIIPPDLLRRPPPEPPRPAPRAQKPASSRTASRRSAHTVA
jgi:hypothetical protein